MKVQPLPRSAGSLIKQVGIGLGRLDGLNPRMLLALSLILFLTDIGYEGQQDSSLIPWLLIYSPASILAFVCVFVIIALFRRTIKGEAGRAITMVIAAMVAVTAKSLVLLSLLYGSSFLPNFLERIGGDVTVAGLYIVIAAVMFHAYEHHSQVIAELNRVSGLLEEQKQTTIEVASDVEAELKERATASLGAELDRIAKMSEAVFDSVETSTLKIQIQALVRNQVRPLSRELDARVKILRTKATQEIAENRFWDLRKLSLIPGIDASFVSSYVIVIPNIFFTLASKAGALNALWVLAVSITYPILGKLLQFILPKKRLTIGHGLGIIALANAFAYIPTGVALYLLGLQFQLVQLTTSTAIGVLTLTCLASTAWFALQRTRDENAESILRINAEIRHELDLLDQAVWVAQRKWSYIIHGTVQGALTVASSRLEMATRPDGGLRTLVRADIERAKAVLVNPPKFERPVRELFDEIATTWQGVCEFEYNLSASAEVALTKRQTSIICLVEICKELISNANRHGGARKFWLNAHLDKSGDLAIVAGNNGKAMSEAAVGGLGYEMITQLTSDWKVVGNGSSNFSATLPLARR